MKRTARLFLIVCLCACLLFGSTSFVFAASDDSGSAATGTYADQWEYGVTSDGIGYYMLDAVYCTNPVDPELQHLVIYAPEAYMTQNADGTVSINPDGTVVSTGGVTYTAETAPIIYFNNSGGYSCCTVQSVERATGYLNEGYVAVSMATRGKESQDADGLYIGQFPAIMVDLKAGIRFLKYYDDEFPGNSDRIVSIGASSGGGVTTMLAASGNSPIFDSYLEEIGAYDTSDDIFMAVAGAPITNLSSADASYEWFQIANTEYFLFDAMAYDREGNYIGDIFPVGRNYYYPLGSNILGGAHEDELSALLYDWYVDYVQGLGLDLGDDGRSGSYFTGFEELYSESLNSYMHRYDEVGDSKYAGPAEYMEYLNSLSDEPWVLYDAATDTYSITSFDDYVSAFLSRNKMCPSLDSYNYKSNENNAFVDPDGTTEHFSGTVRDMLKILMDDEDGIYNWTEEELEYITELFEDYDRGINDDSTLMLEIMSPINYILETDEMYEGATMAPYWRLRIGSSDGDHGAPAAWLIAEGLEANHPEVNVDMAISWGMGHGQAELTDQDLYDYIDATMVTEDGLKQVFVNPYKDVSSDAWYYDAVMWASENGLMNGMTTKTFEPDTTTTRAMLVTTLYREAGSPAVSGTSGFSDVPSNAWFADAINWAAKEGIVTGYDENTFGPDDPLTREQLVTILYRYAGSPNTAGSLSQFSDAKDVSDYAADAMCWAIENGIIEGRTDGTLDPQGEATRAELATILMRCFKEAAPTISAADAIESVYVLGTIDWDCSKTEAIVVEYCVDLTGADISASTFEVNDYGTTLVSIDESTGDAGQGGYAANGNGIQPGAIMNVYVNDKPEMSETGGSGTGNYVIIEVNTDFFTPFFPGDWTITMAADVTQVAAIETEDYVILPSEEAVTNYTTVYTTDRNGVTTGTNYAVEGGYEIEGIDGYELHMLESDKEKYTSESTFYDNIVGDAFHATYCFDEADGQYWDLDLAYALYVPEDYDPNQEYALLLHYHDASTMGTDPILTLTEASGPYDYASDEFQQLYKDQGLGGCIVVCPAISANYEAVNSVTGEVDSDHTMRVTQDNWTVTCVLAATWQLMDYMTDTYNIDMNRIYGTGQSMGGMAVLEMAAQRDNYFAAIMSMSCKWGNNYDKDQVYGGRFGATSHGYYASPTQEEDPEYSMIWAYDCDGNAVDYQNWYYMISDDNIFFCRTVNEMKELHVLYEDLCGVNFPQLFYDVDYSDSHEKSLADRSALAQELLSMENETGLYEIVWEGDCSHNCAWMLGHDTWEIYEWCASCTKEQEDERSKQLNLLNDFELADVQNDDYWHSTEHLDGGIPTGKLGSGTANYNSYVENLGYAGWLVGDDGNIYQPGWTKDDDGNWYNTIGEYIYTEK